MDAQEKNLINRLQDNSIGVESEIKENHQRQKFESLIISNITPKFVKDGR